MQTANGGAQSLTTWTNRTNPMTTQAIQLPSEMQKETSALQRQISSIKVTDGDSYSIAIQLGKEIKQQIKARTEFFAPMKRKADEAKRAILDAEHDAVNPLKEAAAYLDRQIGRA